MVRDACAEAERVSCCPRPFALLSLQGFKLGLCAHPPVGLPYSMLCLSNNCCIGQTLETLLGRFHKLYKRKCVSALCGGQPVCSCGMFADRALPQTLADANK